MSASRWIAEGILNNFFRGQNVAPPTQRFMRLFISDPTPDAVGTEVQGGGYVPQAIAFTAPERDGDVSQIVNTAEIRFPVATADWGNISHYGIFTAATGGNMLAFAPVTVPKAIEAGDEAKFLAGACRVRVLGQQVVASAAALEI